MTFVVDLGETSSRTDFSRNVDVGMETMQIVQVDQQFIYYKPCIGSDDKTRRPMDVDIGERAAHGADIVVTKNSLHATERWRGRS